MAGTVRKYNWTTRKGEARSAWVADYFDQNRKRHTKHFATKKAAEAWLLQVRVEVRDGLHTPDADSITIAEASELWLRRRELKGAERGSLRTYAQYTRLYIVPLLGKRKLSRLNAPLVEAFCDVLLGEDPAKLGATWPPPVSAAGKRGRPLKYCNDRWRGLPPRRARSVLAALRSLLNEAQRRGLVAQNVALAVRIEDNQRDEKPIEIGVDVPSKAEAQALLQSATAIGIRERSWIVVAIFTGLRASELRGLGWSDLDFNKRVLSVRRRADWWGALGPPKSKNGYRDIPLTPLVVNTLKEWQLACPSQKNGLDLVFPNRTGDVIHHTSLQYSFDEVQLAAGAVDAAGRPKYGLHALRHFFASWGIEQGFSPKRLQILLGHGSIRMTYDTYGHLFPSAEDDHARFAAGEAALLGVRPV